MIPNPESDAKTELQMLTYEAERMLEAPAFVAPEAWRHQVRLMARATTAYFAPNSAVSVTQTTTKEPENG